MAKYMLITSRHHVCDVSLGQNSKDVLVCIVCGKDLTSLHKERSFSEDSKGSADPVNRCYHPGPC